MCKILISILAVTFIYLVIPSSKATAQQTTCRRDYFGNIQCTGSNGYSSTINRDYFGNDVIRNNQTGQTTRCHYDYFRNYVCN